MAFIRDSGLGEEIITNLIEGLLRVSAGKNQSGEDACHQNGVTDEKQPSKIHFSIAHFLCGSPWSRSESSTQETQAGLILGRSPSYPQWLSD